mmetsp:Transcript_18987/g.60374  ORF Transcript_18987/g.60374 Transcript_18987/m.60374 type:complete len:320 (-) Transcript_18987:113-1072(-)
MKRATYRHDNAGAYSSYSYFPDRPHCDRGDIRPARPVPMEGPAAFPGGAVKKAFGSDLSRLMYDLASRAKGPASAGQLAPLALATQSAGVGAGLVQAVVSAVLHTVPPLIPPPAWNNKPLFCLPMLTGHNCLGAVLYPITMSDFVLADVTDAMLDGVIAGFPNTYASKVGKTSNAMYKTCFSAYMSMHCSSVFPRCTEPQSRDEPQPLVGRVPMCLHLCIFPLVMCPGFWVNDILGPCSMVSIPPMCTQAVFWNLFKLPPQYISYDEANPFPRECPRLDTAPTGVDALEDPALYEAKAPAPSPILAEAAAAKLPRAHAN